MSLPVIHIQHVRVQGGDEDSSHPIDVRVGDSYWGRAYALYRNGARHGVPSPAFTSLAQATRWFEEHFEGFEVAT